MPANNKVSAGFRSASRAVSESGRDESATAMVAAVELLALSEAFAPETSATTAIKVTIIFIPTPVSAMLGYWRIQHNHSGILCSQNGCRNAPVPSSSAAYDSSAND